MRIEAYTQVQQLYQTQKVNKAQQAGSVSRTDKVQISSLGKDIQTAKAAVASAPDDTLAVDDVTAAYSMPS